MNILFPALSRVIFGSLSSTVEVWWSSGQAAIAEEKIRRAGSQDNKQVDPLPVNQHNQGKSHKSHILTGKIW